MRTDSTTAAVGFRAEAPLARARVHPWIVTRDVTRYAVGGYTARRLLSAALLLPFVLGWARLPGEAAGLFGPVEDLVLVVVATVAALATLVWWIVLAPRRRDRARERDRRLELERAEVDGEYAAADGGRVEPSPDRAEFRAWSELFLDHLEDYAVFIVDAEGRIVRWNRGAQRTTGYSADEVLGRPFSIFYPDEEDRGREPIEREMRIALERGKFAERAWRIKAAGAPFFAEETLVPIRDPDGLHIGFGKIFRDLTEERRVREAAEAADRARSDFLAVMSHELRTPLTAIIGYEDLLESGIAGPLTDEQMRQLRRIKASAIHLRELIEEILTFSRLEAGREQLRIESADAVELARETADVVAPHARQKGLRLEAELPAAPLEVETDPSKVRRILLNLLNNSVSFTDEGEVRLALEDDDDVVIFRVQDTGIGIAPDARDRVFEPFWQEERGLTREVGGTGLGLAVARRLARMLGGDITLQSEVGSGSTFTVTLPEVTERPDA